MAVRSGGAAMAWSWASAKSADFIYSWYDIPPRQAPINSLLGGAARRYSAFSAVGPLKMPFGLASWGKKSCW